MGEEKKKKREKTCRIRLLPGSLTSREQKPLGVSVWCRTVQCTLGSMRRDAVSAVKRKPGAGLHGVWKALELPRAHINRPDKDYFSFVPLVHCVPPLDSESHLLHSLR